MAKRRGLPRDANQDEAGESEQEERGPSKVERETTGSRITQRIQNRFGNRAALASVSGESHALSGILDAELALGAAGVESMDLDSNHAMQMAHELANPYSMLPTAVADRLSGGAASGGEAASFDTGSMSRDAKETAAVDGDTAVNQIRRSRGGRLPPAVAARIGRALGADISHARVHTDTPAAEAAEAVRARAFAVGPDIFFNRGEYRPGTPAGDELLAHELTHVVQHQEGRINQSPGGEMDVSSPNDPHELEAVQAASDAMEVLDGPASESMDFGMEEEGGIGMQATASSEGAMADANAYRTPEGPEEEQEQEQEQGEGEEEEGEEEEEEEAPQQEGGHGEEEEEGDDEQGADQEQDQGDEDESGDEEAPSADGDEGGGGDSEEVATDGDGDAGGSSDFDSPPDAELQSVPNMECPAPIPAPSLDNVTEDIEQQWVETTGLTPAQHQSQITSRVSRVTSQVETAQNTIIAMGTSLAQTVRSNAQTAEASLRSSAETAIATSLSAYDNIQTNFETAESQALGSIPQLKATGLAAVDTAQAEEMALVTTANTEARAAVATQVQNYLPRFVTEYQAHATALHEQAPIFKTEAETKGTELAAQFDPGRYTGDKSDGYADGILSLKEDIYKKKAEQKGKSIGARAEAEAHAAAQQIESASQAAATQYVEAHAQQLTTAINTAQTQSEGLLQTARFAAVDSLDTQAETAETATSAGVRVANENFQREYNRSEARVNTAGDTYVGACINSAEELANRIEVESVELANSLGVLLDPIRELMAQPDPLQMDDVFPLLDDVEETLVTEVGESERILQGLFDTGTTELGNACGAHEDLFVEAMDLTESEATTVLEEGQAAIGAGVSDFEGNLTATAEQFRGDLSAQVELINTKTQEFITASNESLEADVVRLRGELVTSRETLFAGLRQQLLPLAARDTFVPMVETQVTQETIEKVRSLQTNCQKIRKAIAGCGTDEEAVYANLRSLSHGEIEVVHGTYNRNYSGRAKKGKTPLWWDVYDDFSGDEYKIVKSYLNHNRVEAIRLELEDSQGWWNDDEERIETVLRVASNTEIEALVRDHSSTLESVKSSLSNTVTDQDVFLSLIDTSLSHEERSSKAHAIRLFDHMEGLGTDEKGVETILKNATTQEERARLRQYFSEYVDERNQRHRDRMNANRRGRANRQEYTGNRYGSNDLDTWIEGDFSGDDELYVSELAKEERDQERVNMALALRAGDGGGTDEQELFTALDDTEYRTQWEAASPEEREVMERERRERLDGIIAEMAPGEYGGVQDLLENESTRRGNITYPELRRGVRDDGSPVTNADRMAINHYLEREVYERKLQTGACEPDLLLRWAVFGGGTTEKSVKDALSNGGSPKTKSQVNQIRADYRRIWGEVLASHNEFDTNATAGWSAQEIPDPVRISAGDTYISIPRADVEAMSELDRASTLISAVNYNYRDSIQGFNDFAAPTGRLNNELSGQDWFDVRVLLMGQPSTPLEVFYLAQMQYKYQTSGMAGGPESQALLRDLMVLNERLITQFQENYGDGQTQNTSIEDLSAQSSAGDVVGSDGTSTGISQAQEFMLFGNFVSGHAAEYGDSAAAFWESCVTVLEIVGGIIATIATAGVAGGVIWPAIVADLTISAAGIALRAATLGDRYGYDALAEDLLAASAAGLHGLNKIDAIATIANRAADGVVTRIPGFNRMITETMSETGLRTVGDAVVELTSAGQNRVLRTIHSTVSGTVRIGIHATAGQAHSLLTNENTYEDKPFETFLGESGFLVRLVRTYGNIAVGQLVKNSMANSGIGSFATEDALGAEDGAGMHASHIDHAMHQVLMTVGTSVITQFVTAPWTYDDAGKFWEDLWKKNLIKAATTFADRYAESLMRYKSLGQQVLDGSLNATSNDDLAFLSPAEKRRMAAYVIANGGPVSSLPKSWYDDGHVPATSAGNRPAIDTLNVGTQEEIAQYLRNQGVSEQRVNAQAQSVVAHRDTNGWFGNVNQLQNVNGISAATSDRAGIIDLLNQGSVDDLQNLPGIDLEMATAIITYRGTGEGARQFRSMNDLSQVSGLNASAMEQVGGTNPHQMANLHLLNNGTAEELQEFPGIDEEQAAQIVAFRNRNPTQTPVFNNFSDINNVPDMGGSLAGDLESHRNSSVVKPRRVLDILNDTEAGEAEITAIGGFGPAAARRIIEARSNGTTFGSIEELGRIGIAPGYLQSASEWDDWAKNNASAPSSQRRSGRRHFRKSGSANTTGQGAGGGAVGEGQSNLESDIPYIHIRNMWNTATPDEKEAFATQSGETELDIATVVRLVRENPTLLEVFGVSPDTYSGGTNATVSMGSSGGQTYTFVSSTSTP